jgi:membrane-associated protein
MEIFNFLEQIIVLHPVLAVFVSSFFSEEIIVFLAILSGRGIINFWIVFCAGILGLLCFDSLCFLAGKSKFGKYVEEKFFKEHFKSVGGINKSRAFFYLFVTKFIYGTRIASLMYYGMRKMSYKRFVVYDFVSLVFWACIMLGAGWLAGKGFDVLLRVTKGAGKLAALVLVTLVLVYIIRKIFQTAIKREVKYLK